MRGHEGSRFCSYCPLGKTVEIHEPMCVLVRLYNYCCYYSFEEMAVTVCRIIVMVGEMGIVGCKLVPAEVDHKTLWRVL